MFTSALVDSVSRHAPLDGFNETLITGLRLYRQEQPTSEPMPVVYKPSVCVIVQGRKRLQFGDRALTYDPGNYLVNALTLPLQAEIPEASSEVPFLGFLVEFESVQVGTLLAEIDGLIHWPPESEQQTIGACPMDAAIQSSLERLVGCLDDAIQRKVLADAIIRELLVEVLRGPRGHVLRQQAANAGRAHQVSRAVAYLEQHYREPLDVGTIAKQAAMSPSTLHQHFKKLTALSPMQYVQRLRLHQARALLLVGHAAAEAGYEVGYNSPSQFSREFRRLFGVPPSQVRQGVGATLG
ncbi:MAG: AraC family transcriptional regulator [Acidobacteriota bacterium]